MRIASLLPAATEILCELGLQQSIVGISHQCDYPDEIQCLPKLTGSRIPTGLGSGEIDSLVRETIAAQESLYWLDTETLTKLEPDLIVYQSICDVCAITENDLDQIRERLPNTNFVSLHASRLDDVFQSIETLAIATDCRQQGLALADKLQARVQTVSAHCRNAKRKPTVALLEWLTPLFSAGHWNPGLVDLAGAVDVFGIPGAKSREINIQMLADKDPDILILACCGISAEDSRQEFQNLCSGPIWRNLKSVRQRNVFAIDGNAYFNRPGPRLIDGLECLANTIHPHHSQATSHRAQRLLTI